MNTVIGLVIRRFDKKRLIAIALLMLLGLENSVFATAYSSLDLRGVVASTTPNVALQSGVVANSTIFTNSTSARVTTPTLNYPTGNNTVKGTWVSGTVPASVNAIDSNYFTYTSVALGATQTVKIDLTFRVSSVSPSQLNLTIVQQYTSGSVGVTITFFNYTSGAFAGITEQGYLAYTSSATPNIDDTNSLTVTTNPSSYVSAGVAKIEIAASVGGNPPSYQQKINFVRLYYYQPTYDYVLKIVNQKSTSYNIRLDASSLAQANIGRLTNFTAWFYSPGSVQLQVLSGSFTTQTGSLYTLGASATIFLAIRLTTSGPGLSTIDCYLRTYPSGGTTTHADYRLTFKIT